MSFDRRQHKPDEAGDRFAGLELALADIAKTLLDIRELLDTETTHRALGGASMEERLEDWPVAGEVRVITPSKQGGGSYAIAAGAWTDLLQPDAGRAGFRVVNAGANPCDLFLAARGDAQGAGGQGVARINLPAGQPWDGKLGDDPWCGAVSVLSAAGTTLSLAIG